MDYEEQLACLKALLVRSAEVRNEIISGYYAQKKWQKSKEIEAQILSLLPDIGSEGIRAKIRGKKIILDKSGVYLLPRKEDPSQIPVLLLNIDTEKKTWRLYLNLFFVENDTEKEKTYCYTFRFETPEQPGDDGTESEHNYHHFQFCRTRREFADIVLGLTDQFLCKWVPEKFPAVPVMARNPVELLICLLTSLYGWEFFEDQYMIRDPTSEYIDFANRVKERLFMKEA